MPTQHQRPGYILLDDRGSTPSVVAAAYSSEKLAVAAAADSLWKVVAVRLVERLAVAVAADPLWKAGAVHPFFLSIVFLVRLLMVPGVVGLEFPRSQVRLSANRDPGHSRPRLPLWQLPFVRQRCRRRHLYDRLGHRPLTTHPALIW